jgi:hypothetical protein
MFMFGNRRDPVTWVPAHGTFGSLTFRGIKSNVCLVFGSPDGQMLGLTLGGESMKLIHVCYLAFGFAVARLLFRREPVQIADPVSRLRASGLL